MLIKKLILSLIAFLFLFSSFALASSKKDPPKKHGRYKKGEILVKYKAFSQANKSAYFKNKFRYFKIKTFRRSRIHHLKLPKSKGVQAAVEELLKDPNVEYAEPNYAYYATASPNDEHFSKLWGLHNTGQDVNGTLGTPDADIDAPEAWDIITNAGNVIVAVVDSGVDYNHPDLVENIWVNTGEIPDNGIDDDGNGKIDDVRGWDFVDNDNDPMDLDGHGTHIAGTIGSVGNNGIGITGVAWTTKIMVVRGLNPRGWGWISDLADAIEYASENGADVINLSWGGEDDSETLKGVIENSSALLVCAAGNDSADTDIEPHYPSSYTYPNIISVAANDQDDNLASFSNYGNTSVDVAAPGVEIYSTISSRKTIFSNDFDDGNTSGWTSGGTGNYWGASTVDYWTEPYSLADTPTGNYINNMDSWIQTPPIDLSSEDSISFNFNFIGTVLDGDNFPCEVSTNGSDWFELDSGSFNFNDWYSTGYDVTPYKSTSTRFRFRMVSDATGTEDGVYIDDVEITAFDEYTYAFKSGTSMAAPHVSGIAALVKAMKPEYTSEEIKTVIEDNVEPLSSLSGKCATGGRVNLNNLTYLYVPPTTLPYSEDFSGGLPDSADGWSYYSSNAYGQIQVVDETLRMDTSSLTYTLNEAVLSLDLLRLNDVQLDFFQAEFLDGLGTLPDVFSGHYNGDGVSISSDGKTWYTIVNSSALDTGSAGQMFSIRLDAEVARIQTNHDPEFGYTSNFKIKFQQFDNNFFSSTGREWDNIEISVIHLFSLAIPNSATEGDGTFFGQGQISFEAPAFEDTIINLTSSDLSEAMVPETVTVLAGQTSANFDITIIDDGILDGPQLVEIGASGSGYPLKTNIIQVHDNETTVLTLDLPADATEGDGTMAGQGIVMVSQAVDEDVVVALQSDDASELTVPENITILAGQTSAAFDLSIIDDNVIDGSQDVLVSAMVEGWGTGSNTTMVLDNDKHLMIHVPSYAYEGAGVLQDAGQISIVSSLDDDLAIELLSDDTSEITVPPSITLPAGQTSVRFDITMIDDGILDGDKNATIEAFSPGWGSDTAAIIVIEGALRIGSEFQVNTYTNSWQNNPSVTGLENGGFVVTWHNGQDGSGSGVYGQTFNSYGTKIGAEFKVNTYTDSNQLDSSVTGLENGGFVVTWESDGQDGSSKGVYGQMFDSSGSRIASEFQVNTYTNLWQSNPSVAGLENSRFVVTWQSEGPDGSGTGICGQIFDSYGTKIGAEFQVNTYTNSSQIYPSVTGLENGGFVVTWMSYGQDGSYDGIYGQMFDSYGTKIASEFQVNTYTNNWQRYPSIAGLINNGFVVTWQSDGQDGSSKGVYGQMFDSAGVKFGVEFQVNTYTNSWQNNPSVTGLENGWFVVTWQSDGQDGSGNGVYGQMFDSAGIRIASEFQVNTDTTGDQEFPSIAGLENGDFVIAWMSNNWSTDRSIYAQLFTVDTDMDFLTDKMENAGCTNPLDADTDDDGIVDGNEDLNRNGIVDTGETDPCDTDSDDDGIQDGTELGYTINSVGSDTDTNIFIPDADPSTTTNPLLSDTDDDGISDGQEDINKNGRVDSGESDPEIIQKKLNNSIVPIINLLLLE